ncbi:MAG: hypothetical protein ACOC5F_04720 [Candidatus Aminicenantaceae bacterium]
MKLELTIITVLLIAVFLIQPTILSAQYAQGHPEYKDPWLAFIFSFLVPGLGQIWVGDVTRGLIFLGAAVVISVVFSLVLWTVWYIWPILYLGISIFAGLDAKKLAEKHNQGRRLALLEKAGPNLQPAIVLTK